MTTLRDTRIILVCLIILIPLIPPVEGDSDWPMKYHDEFNSSTSGLQSINYTYEPYPLWAMTYEEKSTFTPISADLDGDGWLEILYPSGNRLHIYDMFGFEIASFHAEAGIVSVPSVADIDGDSTKEIIIADSDGNLLCLDNNAEQIWNFTLPVPVYLHGSPVISDITDDEGLEILITTDRKAEGPKTDTFMFCLSSQGEEIWRYHDSTFLTIFTTSPAVADLDGDGIPEIIAPLDIAGKLKVINNKGGNIWSQQLGYSYSPVAIADVVEDDDPELIVCVDKFVYCFSGNGAEKWKFPTREYIIQAPVVGDLNGDGNQKIIVVSDRLYCLDSSGEPLWNTTLNHSIRQSPPSLGDIDGDGTLEILIGDSSGNLYCLDSAGEQVWAIPVGDAITTTPNLCDLEGDGTPEIIISSSHKTGSFLTILDLPLSPVDRSFDLGIEENNIFFSNEYPIINESVIVTASIRNTGTMFVRSFDVTFESDGTIFHSDRYSIPANSTLNVKVNWNSTILGEHTIRVVLDRNNTVNETDENNNEAEQAITVYKTRTDIILDPNCVLLTRSYTAEGQYSLSFLVINDGLITIRDLAIEIRLDGETVTTLHRLVSASTERTMMFQLDISKGDHILEILADPLNIVGETNETNNNITYTFSLIESSSDEENIPLFVAYVTLLSIILLLTMIVILFFIFTRKLHEVDRRIELMLAKLGIPTLPGKKFSDRLIPDPDEKQDSGEKDEQDDEHKEDPDTDAEGPQMDEDKPERSSSGDGDDRIELIKDLLSFGASESDDTMNDLDPGDGPDRMKDIEEVGEIADSTVKSNNEDVAEEAGDVREEPAEERDDEDVAEEAGGIERQEPAEGRDDEDVAEEVGGIEREEPAEANDDEEGAEKVGK